MDSTALESKLKWKSRTNVKQHIPRYLITHLGAYTSGTYSEITANSDQKYQSVLCKASWTAMYPPPENAMYPSSSQHWPSRFSSWSRTQPQRSHWIRSAMLRHCCLPNAADRVLFAAACGLGAAMAAPSLPCWLLAAQCQTELPKLWLSVSFHT